MEERQKEVEAKAPIVKTRLEDYRDRLTDLRISEAQYQELLSMPPEGLHVIDQVKVRDRCWAWWIGSLFFYPETYRVDLQHP